MTLAHAKQHLIANAPPQDVLNSRLEHEPTRDSAGNSLRPDDKRRFLLLAIHQLQQKNDSFDSPMSTYSRNCVSRRSHSWEEQWCIPELARFRKHHH